MAAKFERIQIIDENHFKSLIKSPDDPRLFIVDVYSSWCGPCNAVLPTLKQLFLTLDNFPDRCCCVAAESSFIPELTAAAAAAAGGGGGAPAPAPATGATGATGAAGGGAATPSAAAAPPPPPLPPASSTPKFLLYKDGNIIDEIQGANAPLLKQRIEELAPPLDQAGINAFS